MASMSSSSDPSHEIPLGELLRRLAEHGTALCEAQVGMARVEIATDLDNRVRHLRVVVAGMLLALCGIQLLVVALVLALAAHLGGWLATLIVSVPFLVGGAAILLTAHSPVGAPFMEKTLEALKEDLRWLRSLLR